jgi:Ca-activated chloride channel homolog
VVEVVEQLGETVGLQVLILVDTSASMKTKIPSVKQALRDLSLSMQAREGRSRFALWTFPGARSEAQLNIDWTNELRSLEQHFTRLSPQGTTPTGPALEQCLRAFTDVDSGADEEGMYPDHAL